MTKLVVIDDYLQEGDFNRIRRYFEGEDDDGTVDGSCCWQYVPGCVGTDDPDGHFHFSSLIYSMHHILVPRAFNLLQPILQQTGVSSLGRIKANCMVQTHELKVMKLGFHTDFPRAMTTGIFYINDNDGYTLLEDGTKIHNVANRFAMFP